MRLYRGFLNLCGLAAGVAFAWLAAMVSLDVLIRNVGIGNFPWLIEIAEYILYVATFVAAPWVLHQGAHVRVDLLVERLPAAAARVLEMAMDVVGAAVSVVLLYFGLTTTLESHGLNAVIFKELAIPEWWLLAAIPVPALLLLTEFALRIVRALKGPSGEGPAAPLIEGP